MQDKITIADAPDCLNTNDRAMWVLGYQAALGARRPCLLQIQEPPTKTEALAHYSQQAILAMGEAAHAAVAVPAIDALREAEAALEVAIARTLKASPGHAISVTSEAKALVAVRAALAATPAAAAPLPLLVRDIARELGITCAEACLALKPLGNCSTNTAVTAEMMAKLRECFPERVPASEVAGARERMTAGRACYFMERFLKEEKLLGPNEQAALNFVIDMLEAAAAPVVLPEPDAALLNQGIELLHALSCDERNRGNCSAAEGATASADAVQRLAVTLLAGVSAPAGSETNTLRDLLNRRPAVNAGLIEEYTYWNSECYQVMGANAATPTNDAAPQAKADARDAVWLQPADMAALERFAETADDDHSFDISKEALQRLSQFGCLRNHSFGQYSVTSFGSYLLNDWSLARKLPFKMQAERDAEHCAAVAAQAAQQTQGGE